MEAATYNQGERGLQPMKPKYAEVRKGPLVRGAGAPQPVFRLHALHDHDNVGLPDTFSSQYAGRHQRRHSASRRPDACQCGRMWGFCKRTQRSFTKSPFDDLAMQRTPHWVSLVKLIANRPSIVRTSKVPNKVR